MYKKKIKIKWCHRCSVNETNIFVGGKKSSDVLSVKLRVKAIFSNF